MIPPIQKSILILGTLAGAIAMGSAVISMMAGQNSPQWMYSANQAADTSSRVGLGFQSFYVLSQCLEIVYKKTEFSLKILIPCFTTHLLSLAAMTIAAYRASFAWDEPALPPLWNALGLIFSSWKFNLENSTAEKFNDRHIGIFLSGTAAFITAHLSIQSPDFYDRLLYTNLALMSVSLGYFIRSLPQWKLALPMASAAVLQLSMASALETSSVKFLLGSASLAFGLGVGLLNLCPLIKSPPPPERTPLLDSFRSPSIQQNKALELADL